MLDAQFMTMGYNLWVPELISSSISVSAVWSIIINILINTRIPRALLLGEGEVTYFRAVIREYLKN